MVTAKETYVRSRAMVCGVLCHAHVSKPINRKVYWDLSGVCVKIHVLGAIKSTEFVLEIKRVLVGFVRVKLTLL